MPFDATPLKPIDRLIDALRGPEPNWWNFSACETCAMHSAVEIGLAESECTLSVAQGLWPDLSSEGWWNRHLELQRIFAPAYEQGMSFSAIRPHHVADALEHYKLTGEAKSPFHFAKR
jgi:hypothetical protein